MKSVTSMDEFVQMHIDLGLPMPKSAFKETIPMPHRLPRSFPTVHEIFRDYYDEGTECYALTHGQAVAVTKQLKDTWATAVDTDYKGFGTGDTFKGQLIRFSLSDEGKGLGLQARRNFRLAGAIHFETPEQARSFLDKWNRKRAALESDEE